MKRPARIWPLLPIFLFILSCHAANSANDVAVWEPTPLRLSYIDGEVSYWRQGAEEWAAASLNLPLAEGDALYTGKDANFEVQFGSRSFVRADEYSQLTFAGQEEGRFHFNVTSGLVSFDMRRLQAGSSVEVSTPNAVFLIDDPGYYRVDVEESETHFITRHGGQATVTTADGRSMSINPAEDIVVTAGEPVQVASYAAPPPDAWDQWNDERTDRLGESISARYLSPGIYGAEELDHYGYWRVVPDYGDVWIPDDVSVSWVPYSTGYWVWDPYYEWTWVDEAPWGWAPFHYGRWVFIDGYWAWAPGPLVQRAIYSPALVAFITPAPGVSVSVSAGWPALWWVALGWGEPVVPWWHHHKYYGHPRWDGWGGPRLINDREWPAGRAIDVKDIRYRNAARPHAIRTEPAGSFGRERMPITEERHYPSSDFTPLRGELPIKPTRDSLYGGAPRGNQPPREILSRPVVSIEKPRQPAPRPWQERATRPGTEKLPEVIYMVPPAQQRRGERGELPRPPYGSDGGPEVSPPPQPPRYGDVKRSVPPAGPGLRRQSEPAQRNLPGPVIRNLPEVIRPSQPPSAAPAPRQPPETPRSQPLLREPVGDRQRPARPLLPPGEMRQERQEPQGQRSLPGQPANQPHRRFQRD